MTPDARSRYLRTRAVTGPWELTGCGESGFAGAVVIPSLAESKRLPATIRTLAANPPGLLARFLIVVVVNHRTDAPDGDKSDNASTLGLLPGLSRQYPSLRLSWVDAASVGRELPVKGGGVGLARKIGLDLALPRLTGDGDPLLVCLDADTLVEPSYLQAIVHHFSATKKGGAIIPFRHQPGETAAEQAAIDHYELFLRSYVLGLEVAGSPYAFHTVGSAMACTATAYARMGGMNRRSAAEDFYFLQQLYRTAGIGQVRGTTVHPAARPSHRVPFGTGRAVGRALAGDSPAIGFYHPECFVLLRKWLQLVGNNPEDRGDRLLTAAGDVSSHLAEYLESEDFGPAWAGLQRNNRSAHGLLPSFHCWFDGLRTMKLIHHLAAGPLPRCAPENALPPLLKRAGLEPVMGVGNQLELLRNIQGND
ncbi:MAG: hypothetical protein CXR31_09835 [Geobacter sp.]|nr:MAG: hypothetical protein CXR31_09835 [Geobacter sp.]